MGFNNCYILLSNISQALENTKFIAGELSAQINAFLAALRRDDRVMFVRRYWFAQPLSEIADAFGTTENNVSVRLGRIRRKLYTYLERKEVTL